MYSIIIAHIVFRVSVSCLGLLQGCTNPGCQVIQATIFQSVVPNACTKHGTYFVSPFCSLEFLKTIVNFRRAVSDRNP